MPSLSTISIGLIAFLGRVSEPRPLQVSYPPKMPSKNPGQPGESSGYVGPMS